MGRKEKRTLGGRRAGGYQATRFQAAMRMGVRQ
jgi:hypothetical protein